jgi:hypothetical protein
MKSWSMHPVIYEINAWVWLQELRDKYDRTVTFANTPREEWAPSQICALTPCG